MNASTSGLFRGLLLALTALALAGCPRTTAPPRTTATTETEKLQIVCTTGMLADAARIIGGDRVRVRGLMGPGVDPHLYKARPSDMELLAQADLIVYHGLHLEAKLAEVLDRLGESRPVLAAAQSAIPSAMLLSAEGSGSAPDPHVWFDVELWIPVCERIGKELATLDKAHAAEYAQRSADYREELEALHSYVNEQALKVPAAQRVLVTAHDAFNYFGRRYGYEVLGLQGISTEAEAGTGDVQRLTDFIVERRLPAIFVESSVPVRNIEALIAAAGARGHAVRVGGSLFSDALGDDGTPEGSYLGMVRHNIDTIVAALGGQDG